jgi:hypothetical protein
MNPTARRVDQILTDTPLAASLLARLAAARQAAQVIAPICAEIAPDFDPLQPGACDLRERVLRIWLRSSAHSTKLRQTAPRLLSSLQRHGLEVNEIKVGVQLGRVREKAPADLRKSAAKALLPDRNQAANTKNFVEMREFSRKLALTLPESNLRHAVSRLGTAVEARLARMRDSDQSFNQQDREKNDAQAEP